MTLDGLTQAEATALDWCLRRQQADWSAADAAELQAWLDASPQHAVAFLRIEGGLARVEKNLGEADPQAAPRASAPMPSASLRARPRRTRRRLAAWAAAITLMVCGGGLFTAMQPWEPAGQYTTSVGSRRTVVLEDGSRVELNTDTRVRAFFDEGSRQVQLVRGEAYFDVRPNPQKPFVVHVDGQRIVVLGTRFAVRRDAQRMRVLVEHGKVRIDPMPMRADSEPPPPLIAVRGDSVLVDQRSALVTTLADARLDNELAWRTGFLRFDDVPLGQVAAEFNRYNQRKLVVDEKVKSIRISGSFESSNLDAFIRLLQQVHDLKVAEHRGAVTVSA